MRFEIAIDLMGVVDRVGIGKFELGDDLVHVNHVALAAESSIGRKPQLRLGDASIGDDVGMCRLVSVPLMFRGPLHSSERAQAPCVLAVGKVRGPHVLIHQRKTIAAIVHAPHTMMLVRLAPEYLDALSVVTLPHLFPARCSARSHAECCGRRRAMMLWPGRAARPAIRARRRRRNRSRPSHRARGSRAPDRHRAAGSSL